MRKFVHKGFTPRYSAIKFEPCGKHKMTLPEGVLITRLDGFPDNHCYEGIEFGVDEHGDGQFTRITAGDYLLTGTTDRSFVVSHEYFTANYEPVDPQEIE